MEQAAFAELGLDSRNRRRRRDRGRRRGEVVRSHVEPHRLGDGASAAASRWHVAAGEAAYPGQATTLPAPARRRTHVAEGFSGAVGAHTLENLEDGAVQGLLADQEAAYNMLFANVADDRGLTPHKVRSWHQLLTRHQQTVVGITPDGRRVQVPFEQ